MAWNEKYQKKIDSLLFEVVESSNFKLINNRFINQRLSYHDEVSVYVSKYFDEPPYIYFSFNLMKRIEIIEKYWDNYAELIRITYNINNPEIKSHTISFNLEHRCPEIVDEPFYDSNDLRGAMKIPINKAGYNQFKEITKYLIFEKLIPKSNEFNDLKILDNMLNDKVELDERHSKEYFFNKDGLIFRRIILAKLVGNPLYEDICNYHRKSIPVWIETSKISSRYEYYKNYPVVLEKVIENLKSVELLKDTILV